MKCLLNIDLLNTQPKQSETRATRNNLHFACSCYKKYVSIQDMRQSKTLDEQSMNASQTSLQPVFSIFLPVGRLMAIKNSFFLLFFGPRSSIILTFSIAAYLV